MRHIWIFDSESKIYCNLASSFWRNHEASLPPAGQDLLLQSTFQIIWAFLITAKECNTTWSNPTCGLLRFPKLSWITEAWTSQQFSFPQAFHVYSSFLMTTDDKSRATFLSLWYRVQVQLGLLSLEQLCAKNLTVSAPTVLQDCTPLPLLSWPHRTHTLAESPCPRHGGPQGGCTPQSHLGNPRSINRRPLWLCFEKSGHQPFLTIWLPSSGSETLPPKSELVQ